MRRRFPGWVYAQGSEPDARFTLANERTFLAWLRTALALLAGGLALELLGLELQPGFRFAASLVLIVSGTVTPVLAWFAWAAAERALRQSRALPASPLGPLLAATVTASGVLLVLAVLTR